MSTASAFTPSVPLSSNSPPILSQPRISPRRAPNRRARVRMLVDHVVGFPDFMSSLSLSLGLGFAGIVGGKATAGARAMIESDRRADYFDALSSDIDSFKRRQELSEGPGNRDWQDVAVDRFSNVNVIPEGVPTLSAMDEMTEFDRLLNDAPAAKRLRKGAGAMSPLPQPGEFQGFEDEV